MRAIKATLFTVFFFGVTAALFYAEIRHAWLVFAVAGLVVLLLAVWIWITVYERLSHE